MNKEFVYVAKSYLKEERYNILEKALSNLLEIAGTNKRITVTDEGDGLLRLALEDV